MEERAAAKAEEARRRREAELRRARKKEQMARDPKRKVALKIENKRRFSGHEEDEEDAKKEKDAIPLRKYEVYGESGPEKVNIVDILCPGSKIRGGFFICQAFAEAEENPEPV
ncbi:STK33 [Symbiodinium natans]|uniref:STK33 protein n=1 Tax=Symbiodinium natans TaxID=878477 RepID=A0A812R1R4_9DINO|nr:STK33 [Symbiodinium natans]